MKIVVTSENIEKGIAGNSCFCPVAISIREVVGKDKIITVCKEEIMLRDDPNTNTVSTRTMYKTPEAVQRFMWMFDSGLVVEPFTFELA
jgi:hypothetical protein